MRDSKLIEILEEIYTDVYKVSNPPAVWNEIKLNKDFDFNNHYCHKDVQDEIFKRIVTKYKVKNKIDLQKLKISYYLGCSPLGCL